MVPAGEFHRMKSPVWLGAVFLLLLAGCSKPPSPPPLPERQQENPLPSPTPASTPLPQKKPDAKIICTGIWTAADAQGRLFDIVIFPNGQAVSTWTEGPSGAQGEQGYWKEDDNRLLVFFNDGWSDVISPSDTGFVHKGFAPGSPPDGPPTNTSPANRLDSDHCTGVWRLNKEPDGTWLYVTLQSSGRAFSTIGGGTEGRWEQTKEGVLCKWPDGWNDLIYPSNGGFEKRSWVGSDEKGANPPDISPALHVGEAPFPASE